ncbi:class I SAM-dependent RNA methyltransferase [Brachybacterium endophyticum]|uniref:Class I SAM-dependent RNA methyltransferase n=1 Tax=Brachybacterium endophyticum TaxID=2182385 RepID=A0A2U2RIY9_9MICO|nr:TRAM domain-containing protein [Brachybacterium endophyticum]PWH05828.1 class I SAM-dependent RNA methyltransferase [Brachybacterium endophyticum]
MARENRGRATNAEPERTALGRLLTLTVGAPAAGGTFVARHEGRVVFVRGAVPGETVVARLLEDSRNSAKARFWRAETLEILDPSPDRVPSVWPQAGTDGVGGAEWAHIGLHAQRRLATEVLQDLLTRAGVSTFEVQEAQVEPAPHDTDGLGWRTRVRLTRGSDGLLGMRGWRSHEVRPVGENPLAADEIRGLGLPELEYAPGVEAVDAVAPSTGRPAVVLVGERLDAREVTVPAGLEDVDLAVLGSGGLTPLQGDGMVTEEVQGRRFRVGATGFWQVHRQAPEVLTTVVLRLLEAHEGETVWDLFGGVGLFASAIADEVGAAGRVLSVEGDKRAGALAAENLAETPQASAETGDVTDWVRAQGAGADRVVVDPPRAGLGPELMGLLCERTRERIVYVSCEPSTLARDLHVAEESGWRIEDLRAFDLFPHTHHIESVAVLTPAS